MTLKAGSCVLSRWTSHGEQAISISTSMMSHFLTFKSFNVVTHTNDNCALLLCGKMSERVWYFRKSSDFLKANFSEYSGHRAGVFGKVHSTLLCISTFRPKHYLSVTDIVKDKISSVFFFKHSLSALISNHKPYAFDATKQRISLFSRINIAQPRRLIKIKQA